MVYGCQQEKPLPVGVRVRHAADAPRALPVRVRPGRRVRRRQPVEGELPAAILRHPCSAQLPS